MSRLEARVEALEKAAASKPASQIVDCLTSVDAAYDEYIRLNGKKSTKPGEVGKDAWTAPAHIFDEAAKNKQNGIERCRLIHGKN